MKLFETPFQQKGIALIEVLVAQLLLGLFVFSFLKTQVFTIALADQSKQDFLAEFSSYQVIDSFNQLSSFYDYDIQLSLNKNFVSINTSCLEHCENLTESHEKLLLLNAWLFKELGEFELAMTKTANHLHLNLAWFSQTLLDADYTHSSCDLPAENFNRCLAISWHIK